MAASASASYPSMLFVFADGNSRLAAVDGLEIAVAGNDNGCVLIVKNGFTSFEIPSKDLLSMEFSSEVASVDTISALIEGSVTAYSLDGTVAGKFDSVTEAMSSLSPAVYIIVTGQGKAIKLNLKK